MTLLRLEGDLPDGVMFQGWDADPHPVGAQVTGIHHPGSDWGIFKRISFGQIIPNPDNIYAIVSYAQGRIEPGSSGSAIFSSPETAVGVASFGEESDFENVCQISQQSIGYTPFSVFYPRIRQFIDKEFALDFAHFANGDSITSSLVFVNVATHPIRPALYFYDKNGNLIGAESVVDVTGDLEITGDGALSVRTEIEPLGELTLSTHGRGNLVTGSVTVDANGPIGGVLRFDLPSIGVAGVGASQPVQDAIFPARRQAGGISTAAAIHNSGEEAMVVNCQLMKAGFRARRDGDPSDGQRTGGPVHRADVHRHPIRRILWGRCAAPRQGCSPEWRWNWMPETASSPRCQWCQWTGRKAQTRRPFWTLRISPMGPASPPT